MRIATTVLALACLLASHAFGHEPEVHSPRVINLVVAGPVDASWPALLSQHLSETLWTPVQLQVLPDPVPAGGAAAVCANLTARMPSAHTVCVAFGSTAPATGSVACEVDVDAGAAVVWGDVLKAPATTADADPATLVLWRIQKQTAFTAARLLGIQPCLFPLCVMHEDTLMEDLDLKARNLCPPCRQAAREKFGLAD